MSELVFDTNILVDHLRGARGALPFIEKVKSGEISGYISVLTVAELFAGRDEEDLIKKTKLDVLLGLFSKLDVNEEMAKIAGRFRRKHGISIIDATIAATAVSLRCKLLTQNIKDFGKVKEIEAEKPY